MVPPSLGFARIRLRAAAPAIVEEAGRHASRLTGGAPRRAPAADGDAVAVEDQRAMGSRRANAATTRSSAAHRPFSGRSSVVSWLRRRTPAFYASREAVRGHVTCWATSRSRTSCPALARPTPVRLEFLILSLNPGLRHRCVAPGVWPTTTEVRSHASLKGHTPLTFAGGHMVARAELNNVSQVSHCRDLVQLPVAA